MSAKNNNVSIIMNNDCLSEIIMVTLVAAGPLMLPLQQTDICIATKIEIVMNGYNYLDNLLALFFFTRRTG